MDSTDESTKIVIAGTGHAGLHTAQRSRAWLRRHRGVKMSLVDRNEYRQLTIELPRLVAGTRDDSAVETRLDSVLGNRVRFIRAGIT